MATSQQPDPIKLSKIVDDSNDNQNDDDTSSHHSSSFDEAEDSDEIKATELVNEALRFWDFYIISTLKRPERHIIVPEETAGNVRRVSGRLQDWAKRIGLFQYPKIYPENEKMSPTYQFSELQQFKQARIRRALEKISNNSYLMWDIITGRPVCPNATFGDTLKQLEVAIDRLDKYIKPAQLPRAHNSDASIPINDPNEETVKRVGSHSDHKQDTVAGVRKLMS